jgi:hypothetical protein
VHHRKIRQIHQRLGSLVDYLYLCINNKSKIDMFSETQFLTVEEYFEKTGQDVDWDKNYKQIVLMEKIISIEVSIFILFRTSGVDESLVDSLKETKKDLIKQYEKQYEEQYNPHVFHFF